MNSSAGRKYGDPTGQAASRRQRRRATVSQPLPSWYTTSLQGTWRKSLSAGRQALDGAQASAYSPACVFVYPLVATNPPGKEVLRLALPIGSIGTNTGTPLEHIRGCVEIPAVFLVYPRIPPRPSHGWPGLGTGRNEGARRPIRVHTQHRGHSAVQSPPSHTRKAPGACCPGKLVPRGAHMIVPRLHSLSLHWAC